MIRNALRRLAVVVVAGALAAAAPADATGIRVRGQAIADGEPLPGAGVELYRLLPGPERGARFLAGEAPYGEAVASDRADAEGRFTVTAPEAGMWRLVVRARGRVPVQAYFTPLYEETALAPVELEPDVGLTVRVVDAEGRPVAGAQVQGEALDRAGRGRPGSEAPRWYLADLFGRADDTGRLALPRAAASPLRLWAFAAGHVESAAAEVRAGRATLRLRAGEPYALLLRDLGRDGALLRVGQRAWPIAELTDAGEGAVATVVLPVGEPLGFALDTGDGRRERGTLTASREELDRMAEEGPEVLEVPPPHLFRGRVVDRKTGAGVAGALVWQAQMPGSFVRADARGDYVLAASGREQVWLRAVAPGYRVETRQPSAPAADTEGAQTFALEPVVDVHGRVVDAAGYPVGGARLVAEPSPTAGGGSWRQLETYSATDGSFRLALTTEVGHRLRASADGHAPAETTLPALAERRPPAVELVLDAGVTLTGRVVDSLGKPVPGADLALARLPARQPGVFIVWYGARELPTEIQTTDAEGAFEVPLLQPGRYSLAVRSPGYAPAVRSDLDLRTRGPVDLGEISLVPGARLEGVVADRQGNPVAEAKVTLEESPFQVIGVQPHAEEGPQTTTGQDGLFAFDDLAAGGRLTVQVRHPEFGPALLTGVEVPTEEPLVILLEEAARLSGVVVDESGRGIESAAVYVNLDPRIGASAYGNPGSQSRGRTDGRGRFTLDGVSPGPIDLQVRAEGYTAGGLAGLEVGAGEEVEDLRIVLERGGRIAGRVVGAGGRPVARASVTAMPVESGGRTVVSAHRQAFSARSAETDGDGLFELAGVTPGSVRVEARHPAYPPASRVLEVGPGKSRVELVLSEGHPVFGQVVDAVGTAIEGARVELQSFAETFVQRYATTGADGTFEISGLDRGTYTATVSKEGFATLRRSEPVQIVDGPIFDLTFVLAPGQAIVGRVLGVEPRDLGRVRVFASQGSGGSATGSIHTDGSYRVTDVGPGDWIVLAMLADLGRQARGTATVLEGAAETPLDLEFGGGLRLGGRVRVDGKPVSGAQVVATGGEAGFGGMSQTDHEGRFRIEGLDPGSYQITVADLLGSLTHQQSVEVISDREIEIDVVTGRLSGRVLDATDGRPLAGVQVQLHKAATSLVTGGGGQAATTGPDGGFTFERVPAGSYRLTAREEGYAAAEARLDVAAQADVGGVELALVPAERVVFQVTLWTGSPPRQVRVALLDGGGRALFSDSLPVGAGGRVELRSVPPGDWQLAITADGAATVTLPRVASVPPLPPIVLPPEAPLRVTVPDLPPAGFATLSLVGAQGRPFLWLQHGRALTSIPFFGRETRVPGLLPGTWRIEVATADGRSWSGSATAVAGTTTEVVLD